MKSKNRKPVYRTGALAIFTSFGAQAYADAAGTAGASDTDSLTEIVVTGVRQAMKDSIDVKKHTALIGDNISTAGTGMIEAPIIPRNAVIATARMLVADLNMIVAPEKKCYFIGVMACAVMSTCPAVRPSPEAATAIGPEAPDFDRTMSNARPLNAFR